MSNLYQKGLDYLAPLQIPMPDYLTELKAWGIENHVPIVADDMGQFLALIMDLYRPAKVLELGCGISYSTHWMLLGWPQAQIMGIDGNKDRLVICQEYLKRSGFEEQVRLQHIYAEDYFLESQETFDLIFQDSAKKGYAGMLEGCYNHLKPGGILVVDNIFYNHKVHIPRAELDTKFRNGVAMLNEFNHTMAQHPGFQCRFFAISDGVLVARKIQ